MVVARTTTPYLAMKPPDMGHPASEEKKQIPFGNDKQRWE
jgi:hypothetical protein